MQTSDANGEISATVDETNRVRAEPGLKPLAAEALIAGHSFWKRSSKASSYCDMPRLPISRSSLRR